MSSQTAAQLTPDSNQTSTMSSSLRKVAPPHSAQTAPSGASSAVGRANQASEPSAANSSAAWLASAYERLPIPRTTSGADGSFRLTGVAGGNNLLAVRSRLPEFHPEASVQLFSALKKTGVDEARLVLSDWLCDR